MADEVPVSDVLCEAMEYLSKLGSNLRSRSETLKEKRIRKDKLKNAHAVQKAAHKVLLICELSKKSLDNVETGVRKILKVVDASQASIRVGGKVPTSDRSKTKFQYFEYHSRKLKVGKKVPLQHYLSVKVMAKGMPVSMQDKYPVYYDCKLYRARRRIAKKDKIKAEKELDSCEEQKERSFERNNKTQDDCGSETKNKGGKDRKNSIKSDAESKKSQHENEIEYESKDEIKKGDNRKSTSDSSDLETNTNNSKRSSEKPGDKSRDSSSENETSKTDSKIKACKKTLSLKRDRKDSVTKKSKDDEDSDSKKESDTEKSESKNKKSSKRREHRKDSTIKKVRDDGDSDSMKESDTDKSDSKKKRKASVTNKTKDDEDSDSRKESDTEKSHSKKSSKRKEHRKDSTKKKVRDDGDSNSMKESDTEKSDSKKKRKDSVTNKSEDDGDSDSRKESDTEKSDSKQSSKLKEHRTDSRINNAKDDEDSDSMKESATEKSDVKMTSSRKEHRKDSVTNKAKDDGDSDSMKESDTEKSQTSSRKENRKDFLTSKTNDDEDSDGVRESKTEKSKSKKSSRGKEHKRDSESRKGDIDSCSKKDKENQTKAKKFKNLKIIEDSSSSSTDVLQNVKPKDSAGAEVVDLDTDDANSDNDSSRLSPDQNPLSSKSNNGDSFDRTADNNDDQKVPQTTDCKTDDNKNSDSDQSQANKPESQKPLIKCVSLTKLLKPDVLPKEERLKLEYKENATEKYKSSLKKDRHDKNPSRTTKKVKYEDEEIFWTQKRKEVKAFKAKDFTVNVSRLPTLSVEFLLANNLKRITQNGSSVCKVTSTDNKKQLSKLSKQSTSELKEKLLENDVIKKVKNDLLNDSDSEKSDSNSRNSLKYVTENVKNALLDESESDKEEVSKNQDKTEDRTENAETINEEENDPPQKENSEVEPTEKTEKTPEREISPTNDPDKVKSSLLKDSSEDSPKTPQSKNKQSDSTTPRSKRKHIMESMHAKKMLLTYSSSSETEDEQLNNVFKEIKDTLLKEISSGEENVKKSVCKKLLASSDSDEDIMKRVKKKRKLNKSISPSSETKEGDEKSGDEKENGDDKDTSCIDQIDGTNDEQSCSSNAKMGRSRGKPGASSSQNSDTQDDKDIDGLTNLNTLNKSRTRDSGKSASTSSKRGKKMPKAAPLITGEGLLEAPSSSEEASAAESEAADEDLPAVQLTGLNGSGIGHLAKDDLLGDSDSSSTNDNEKGKSSEAEDKKQDGDSDTEDNIKSKRRKANAIASSDSEAGSSRRKDQDVRMSDFEDSGEDSSEATKKSKRKKKGTDSDGSADRSSNEEGKKKRRRIKQIDDSDGSGSDTENEGRNKHGRKNIRKVMGKNQLEEATKKAAREEKERMARIIERQKLYNNLAFDESGKPDEVVLDKVVLDFDPETKEPLIEVDRGLVKKLKPHQANGIKFMWDACFESVKRIKKDRGSGCILAHCMGLGKTLQVVSLTHTLLTHGKLTGVNRVLVVCPLSTVLNWVNEFRMWLKHAVRPYELDVYELSRYKQNSERAFQLSQWYEHGGVCVLGYEMFRNLSADNPKKYKKKMLKNFQEALVDPGPDLVVCDEGHLLKNEKTSLSQSMNRVKTRRRIVLTGTPLQNNLKEYYCMVQFVKPNLLGKYNEYLNRFVNPITNGQYTDSTEHDIRVMKRRSHVLHKMLDGAVQRRDYGVLAPFLPPKHEYVLFITLTEVQVKLYQHYLDNYARRPLAGKSSGFLFPDFQSLQRIWTHPLVLKYNSERYEIMQQKKRDKEEEDSEGSLVDFIDDESTPEETSSEESSDDSSDLSDDSRKKSKKKNKAKKEKSKGKDSKPSTRRGTRANPGLELENEEMKDPDILEVKNENPTEWWINLVSDDVLEDMRNSNKLVLLFEILRQCEAIGDKLLVFSQSLYSLDLIEEFLRKVDEATQDGRIDEKLGGHVGSWSPGVDYFRLDGSTSCENRSIWCKNFNREDNPRARLFLISTRAGGLGINLVAANRVVIFDVSWNPSHDVQSIFRVYRFGQKKPCYIYRFLAMGTMEEKIYERQVTKQAISKRVIDEQQIDRHYAANDLAELYMFEPAPPMPRPVPPVPKDRFFAEMLKEHEALIYKFHEHDSLLENKEEETLSEEERKAAWEDFENEKNKPPPAPFPSGWPMNGMVPNMLAQQQQQQLAYAALATMLRKEMPNVSDDQIRSMLPLIYGSNPALMQKLNDLYKYTQPGMMNPGMMNMNASGAAAGMGGGGTSGLQYEPPWQRQQQQQQQMRLQQLMQQQQNAMGAKFYAGGLGSRDPVAMALQQQRAREIMLGDRGRPRGRPPLQPRVPSAAGASGDVVNLDSD